MWIHPSLHPKSPMASCRLLERHVVLGNTLVNMYPKCGLVSLNVQSLDCIYFQGFKHIMCRMNNPSKHDICIHLESQWHCHIKSAVQSYWRQRNSSKTCNFHLLKKLLYQQSQVGSTGGRVAKMQKSVTLFKQKISKMSTSWGLGGVGYLQGRPKALLSSVKNSSMSVGKKRGHIDKTHGLEGGGRYWITKGGFLTQNVEKRGLKECKIGHKQPKHECTTKISAKTLMKCFCRGHLNSRAHQRMKTLMYQGPNQQKC